ncbi:MAG: hypothetical protein HUU15_09370 [Candidatus Brocadiae bacterium]|nr:hypothetical protein [Candidatus Brocadiia bacterium]
MSHDHIHGEPCDHLHGKHPVVTELTHHLPFSVAAVILALVALAVVQGVFQVRDRASLADLFHICHPIHLLLSAASTTGMFWLHDGSRLRAAFIGLVGSAPLCALGDIAFPWLGGRILGVPMTFHICAFEEPWLVWPCVLLGIGTGLLGASHVRKVTLYSHSAHVLVSSFASAIYLVAFGFTEWTSSFALVLLVLLAAVMVPCCLSDIVFPLLFAQKRRRAPAGAPARPGSASPTA